MLDCAPEQDGTAPWEQQFSRLTELTRLVLKGHKHRWIFRNVMTSEAPRRGILPDVVWCSACVTDFLTGFGFTAVEEGEI